MKFDVKLLTEFLLQLQWKLWFPSDYVGSSLLYQTIMFYWTIYQDEIHVKKSVKTWGDCVNHTGKMAGRTIKPGREDHCYEFISNVN